MNIKKIYIILITFLLSFMNTFALDAPSNVIVNKTTETSAEVSWDKIDGAMYYYIYFGNTSGGNYELQTDLIESNSFTIDSLEKGKKYYAVVVSIDSEGVESDYSNEVSFTTMSPKTESKVVKNVNEGFVFSDIKAIDFDKIELSFSKELENKEDSIREFKIVNKADNLDTIEVKESNINDKEPNKVDLVLEKPLVIGIEYEVIAIAISSVSGENIEDGIDAIQTLVLEEGFKPQLVEEKSIQEEPQIELNSAKQSNDELVSGKEVNIKNSNDVLSSSDKNKKLPTTGPEQVLILILTFILTTLIFIFKYKKA